ncbi:MAG: hypothetical protein QNJ31_01900 [Candidatus Caenarcaniphilales bacterium]|nr:hypothetical protein [Candidatus Caenarcaniphilales bacterium]
MEVNSAGNFPVKRTQIREVLVPQVKQHLITKSQELSKQALSRIQKREDLINSEYVGGTLWRPSSFQDIASELYSSEEILREALGIEEKPNVPPQPPTTDSKFRVNITGSPEASDYKHVMESLAYSWNAKIALLQLDEAITKYHKLQTVENNIDTSPKPGVRY